jgi:hypothetical protein
MRVTVNSEPSSPPAVSRWDRLIWPHWLPVRARLPLIAQIAGASALVAAVAMPRLAEVPQPPPILQATPTVPPASTVPAASTVAPAPVVPAPRPRPAHLNLDVRHSFQSVDLSIAVDGRQVLDTTLAGNRKRFGVVGKRAEKSFTKTLDLSPGVRLVRVRVRSEDNKFDQTRVERFDLDSSAVAGMRIAADKSGLSIVAERPAAPEPPVAPRAAQAVQAAQVTQAAAVQIAQAGQVAQAVQEASALAELYQALRNILIAVAGVVASAATGVFVQEFLKSRKSLMRL